MKLKRHNNEVLKLLNKLEEIQEELIELTKEMILACSNAMYPVDLFTIGAIKRTVSTISGFRVLVESFNMICARVLLRTQVDTVLRFYSLFLVENPHDFAMKVISGNRIDKLRDKNGQRMTDYYLRSKLVSKYPWIDEVYKRLSDYVHYSEQHFFCSINKYNHESKTIKWSIEERDLDFPEFSWKELLLCFIESVSIFMEYLKVWIFTKDHQKIY